MANNLSDAPSEVAVIPSDGIVEANIVKEASRLIMAGQEAIARHANAALTLTYWKVGRLVSGEVVGAGRADYGQRIVALVSERLVDQFGRSYEEKNLRRMMQFSQEFPDEQIVVTLSRQLSWSHFLALLPVKAPEARAYYAAQALEGSLTVRELRHLIARKGFERREIANAQLGGGSQVPKDAFRDPYLLDFLGLKDTFLKDDLEAAILKEMEAFLLEVGNGFAFVERQKRMIIDGDDYHLDLLFFSRPLRRLVAIELKVGKFRAPYEGQMKLYLKWLDKYERREGEEAPIGLILCTEASREQIELLEMHKDGIAVAEYWTELPPKAELESKIQAIYQHAQERLARQRLQISPSQPVEGGTLENRNSGGEC